MPASSVTYHKRFDYLCRCNSLGLFLLLLLKARFEDDPGDHDEDDGVDHQHHTGWSHQGAVVGSGVVA